jgi:hypothetical protein
MNRTTFSLCVAVGACFLSWILFRGALAWNVSNELSSAWGWLNIVPFFAATLLSGNAHAPLPALYGAFVFLQWFAIAFFVLFPIVRRWR